MTLLCCKQNSETVHNKPGAGRRLHSAISKASTTNSARASWRMAQPTTPRCHRASVKRCGISHQAATSWVASTPSTYRTPA
jgi:hypothetical protein